MLAVRARVAEAFAALAALERLLPAVKTLVFRQVMLVFERLAADLTREWTLACNITQYKMFTTRTTSIG